MEKAKPTTIDEYMASFPEAIRDRMQQIRATVRAVIPDAGEKISYDMPTFTAGGTSLVYFAGFKNHIGFYPAPVNEPAFKNDLSGYKTGKGSVQFPLKEPLPTELIEKMVRFRLEQIKRKTGHR